GLRAEGAAASPLALTREQLEGVRRREPGALAALFERHFDRVYRLVYRLLGERAAAEDVTQEGFLKVYRAAHRLDPHRDPGPWLMTIAHNACRDVWRSNAYKLTRRSRSVDDEPHLGATLTLGRDDPERHALAAERARLVRQAVEQLPERLRAAVLLHDF